MLISFIRKITAILFFVFMPFAFAEVYLLTDSEGVGHSILLVVRRDANGVPYVYKSLSKQPDRDDTFFIEDGIVYLQRTGDNNEHKSYSSPIYDITTGEGYKRIRGKKYDYSGIKLSVETNSELENRIAEEIDDQNSWWVDDWYLYNNCGQATYEALRDSGYFSDWVMLSHNLKYGGDEYIESPEATEYAVKWQERQNLANARKNIEADIGAEEGDSVSVPEDSQSPDGDEVSVPDSDGDGDNVISGDGDGKDDDVVTPGADSDNGGSVDSGDSQDSDGDSTSLGDIANGLADHFALVGPNIPHYRLLWLFAGENLVEITQNVISEVFNDSKEMQSVENAVNQARSKTWDLE